MRARAGLVARGAALLLAAAAAFALLCRVLSLDLEQHGLLGWAWAVAASLAMGCGLARRSGRLPGWEIAAALALALLGLGLGLWAQAPSQQGLASPAWRALLVAPAVLALCAILGASLGLMGGPAGGGAALLGYEFQVGRRFLLAKASPVISTVTTISVVGVALGVWLVLVSLGILAGFENDLQDKIVGAHAHVVLQAAAGQPFALRAGQWEAARTTPGVAAAAPFLEAEVAVASRDNYTGALMFGIDPVATPEVLTVLRRLQAGRLSDLSAPLAGAERGLAQLGDGLAFVPPRPLPGLAMGVEMAKILNVGLGDKVRLISPYLEVLTPVGAAPKSLGYKVSAIFNSKMYEYDARHIYLNLPDAAHFLNLGANEVHGLQLRCDDPERSERVAAAALTRLGEPPLHALDWKERHRSLFSALKLERAVAFVVLTFIILVASFSIVNTLTMSVLEKQREIAILKTMGACDAGIMKIFLAQGLLIGTFGTGVGATLGVLTMKALERFGFWIPGDVYYIDSLPVRLDMGDVALVVLATLLIIWDFAIFPALRGARLETVEGLRGR